MRNRELQKVKFSPLSWTRAPAFTAVWPFDTAAPSVACLAGTGRATTHQCRSRSEQVPCRQRTSLLCAAACACAQTSSALIEGHPYHWEEALLHQFIARSKQDIFLSNWDLRSSIVISEQQVCCFDACLIYPFTS